MENSLKITSTTEPREFMRELIDKLSFENVKSISFDTKDILLNYTDNSVIEGVSQIIAEWIVSRYKSELILKYVRNNFDADIIRFNDRIVDKSVKSTMLLDEIYSKKIIVKKLTDYIKENSCISVKGFVSFRIAEYKRLVESIVFDTVDEIYVEREYTEFLQLLKAYIDNSVPMVDLLHVYVQNNLKISLYNFKMEEIEVKLEDMDSTEFFLTKDDLLVSVLISLAPKRIIWHNNSNFKNTSLINTLNEIFAERFYLCNGCNLIKH